MMDEESERKVGRDYNRARPETAGGNSSFET